MESGFTHNITDDPYDGERVEKSNGVLYWYGPGGNVLDEINLSGIVINEYVYLSGGRIARLDPSGDAFYYQADELATSRVIAEVPPGTTTATLCYDSNFYPFGGERPYTDPCDSHYKFTCKNALLVVQAGGMGSNPSRPPT